MEAKEVAKREESMMLAAYVESVIERLKEEKKHAAVRTYRSTLNSFTAFVREEPPEGVGDAPASGLSVNAVFTPARLKGYVHQSHGNLLQAVRG